MTGGGLSRLASSKLVRAGLGSGGVRIATVLITLASSIVLARVLGPDGLGIYAFALAIVALAGLPVQLGVPTLVLRETAKAESRGDLATLHGLWRWAGERIAISALCVVPLVALGAWIVADRVVPSGGLVTLWISLALVPLIAAANLRGSALRGMHRIVLGQLPDAVIRPATLLLLLGATALFGLKLGPAGAMSAHVLAALVAFGIGVIFVLRAAPPGLTGTPPDRSRASDWSRAVWPLALISGMQILMESFGVVVLGIWATPQEVGLFRIATAAANMTLFGLTIANLVVAPRFAKLHADLGTTEMARTARITAGVSFLAALPIAATLILAGPWVLGLLYGTEFVPAAGPMAVLAAAQLVNAFFGSCVSLLNMSGYERVTARMLMIAAATNVGLNLILVPFLGIYGAALAMLVSTCLWNGLLNLSVSRHLGFASSALANLTHRDQMT